MDAKSQQPPMSSSSIVDMYFIFYHKAENTHWHPAHREASAHPEPEDGHCDGARRCSTELWEGLRIRNKQFS